MALTPEQEAQVRDLFIAPSQRVEVSQDGQFISYPSGPKGEDGRQVPTIDKAPYLRSATTRELLNELRMRAEAWSGVPKSGAGWLADRVDDALVSLDGGGMLDGRREP